MFAFEPGLQEDKMKLRTMGLVLFVGSTLALGGLGCVEESASILLNGSFAVTGTVETMGTEAEPMMVLTCGDLPTDVSSGNFWSRGQINIASLKECGQYCGFDTAYGPGGGRNTFTFIAGAENLLPDSRTVGGRSGAGNTTLDQNNIWVKEAVVTFPSELNTFFVGGADIAFPTVETVRLMSAYMKSGGGSYFGGLDIIGSAGELANFEGFLREVLNIRTEPVTFIAELQLRGKTQAGTKVESNKIQFPIDICVNCDMGVTPICIPSS
jgi:hypothetical protein